jgi:hypothetical protein
MPQHFAHICNLEDKDLTLFLKNSSRTVAKYITFVVLVAQVFLPLISRLTLWFYPTKVSHMEAILLFLNAPRVSMGDMCSGKV